MGGARGVRACAWEEVRERMYVHGCVCVMVCVMGVCVRAVSVRAV